MSDEELQLSITEQLLGVLLDDWDKRYNFDLDRESMVLKIATPEVEITAEPNEENLISQSVIFASEEAVHTKTGNIEESAEAIEGVLSLIGRGKQ